MKEVLVEIQDLMVNNGYGVEDVKRVTESFNHFFAYISRNNLEEEFSSCISSFKFEVLKKIRNKRYGSNIANMAMFNGTSFAANFIRRCVEKKVQDVLKGFLRSSEIYYNMACNSDGLDVSMLLSQLNKDGINVDKSVELTAPATIISFSTELSLKTLFSVKNYDAIIKNIYSDVTRFENGRYPNEYLFNNKLSLIDRVSGDWKRLDPSNEPSIKNVMNNVRDLFTPNNRPVNLPDNDRDGNVKTNGHTLYRIFYNLPDEFQTMIKYQIVTAFSRSENLSLNEKVVSAIDYFLMTTELDTTLDNIDSTEQMVINSNNFDKMRYLIDQLGSEDLLFSMAFAVSSYVVARSEVSSRSFSALKVGIYEDKGLHYTDELDKLVSSDANKKYLLDYISNNTELLEVAKQLSPYDLYVLIDMFNLDEINWMKASCNGDDSCSFKEMMHYCVFFKKYLNSYDFKYDEKKYKNINKLFYAIKTTNNLAMLGTQITQWFAEINIYSLTQEEFEVLKIFDNEYIYNSLSYKDKVLYKKCNERGVPFKIYYTSSAYASMIVNNIDNPDIDTFNFANEVDSLINQRFNKVLVVNDEQLNKLKENERVYELLCGEFGSYEQVPNTLKGLPVGDIQALLDYCERNGISIKQQAQELMGSSCFFCKSSYILRNVNNKKSSFIVQVPETGVNFFESVYSHPELHGSVVRGPFYLGSSSISMESIQFVGSGFELDVEIDRPTDRDLLDRLLDRGFDFMSATFLQKNCTSEEMDSLLTYVDRFAIPLEVLTAVVSQKISIDTVIEKVDFFRNKECRLDDIPAYYYLRSEITIQIFDELFRILSGVYRKENIPNSLLTKEPNKVSLLLNKLKDENISIYNFMSFMPLGGSKFLDMIDDYIGIYKQIKNVSIDSGMIVKNFDLVVSDYKQIKSFLNLQEDNILLLKTSLYKDFHAMKIIVQYCQSHNVPFMPEYFYFDMDFLKDNLNYIHTIVDAQRRMRQQMTYENALDLMSSMSYDVQKSRKEVERPRKVS